jgi:hypothetical protein
VYLILIWRSNLLCLNLLRLLFYSLFVLHYPNLLGLLLRSLEQQQQRTFQQLNMSSLVNRHATLLIRGNQILQFATELIIVPCQAHGKSPVKCHGSPGLSLLLSLGTSSSVRRVKGLLGLSPLGLNSRLLRD